MNTGKNVRLFLLVAILSTVGCGRYISNSHVSPMVLLKSPPSGGVQQTHVAGKKSQRSPANRFQMARAWERAGKTQAAMQEYQRLTREQPLHAGAYHRLAVMLDQAGNHEASAKYYLTALHIAPQNANVLADYGYSRYIQGDLLLAEQKLREAVALDGKLTRARNNLALVYSRSGNTEAAIEQFQLAGNTAVQARRNLYQAQHAAQLSSATHQESQIAQTSHLMKLRR